VTLMMFSADSGESDGGVCRNAGLCCICAGGDSDECLCGPAGIRDKLNSLSTTDTTGTGENATHTHTHTHTHTAAQLFSSLIIIIINDSSAANQQIRVISEGSCDTED